MKKQALIFVFLLGFALLNYPILLLYNIPVSIGGIPASFFFIFLWLLILTGLTFIAVKKFNKSSDAE
ncbi:MAG: hypothetical protein EP311_08205 [Cytophagales bacterium]|uniref:DUF3311 domain-containing protein n=1 Tax=Algoriphagus taiwanensis TaxID=1445656 RepID=A0ABQ6Q1H5_9BACT|nr:MAG: hypothetical protein EP311_08205 [Cytophagales bacterium]GMQ34031.1 hypothetical protein Ataiwa_23030 [Algoriphagus taiwanensis]